MIWDTNDEEVAMQRLGAEGFMTAGTAHAEVLRWGVRLPYPGYSTKAAWLG